MFKLFLEKPDNITVLHDKIDKVKDIAKNCGYVNVKSLVYVFMGPSYPVDEKSSKMGWSYNTICENPGLTLVEDHGCHLGRFLLELPDPVEYGEEYFKAPECKHAVCSGRGEGLCNNCDGEKCFSIDGGGTFDVISHPAHYTEGRKYEPRKVIADWDLSFNLGNAVKYLARAGRKGDKIEDLRKAIQYIEFEIDECSKSSEYEELLECLKNKPVEEQVKIVEQLKLELNKKYGAGGV